MRAVVLRATKRHRRARGTRVRVLALCFSPQMRSKVRRMRAAPLDARLLHAARSAIGGRDASRLLLKNLRTQRNDDAPVVCAQLPVP